MASWIPGSVAAGRAVGSRRPDYQRPDQCHGIFLVRVHPLLYILDANGLTKLPKDRVPCGAEVNAVHRLANDRWAFVTGDRIFISPPGFRFKP